MGSRRIRNGLGREIRITVDQPAASPYGGAEKAPNFLLYSRTRPASCGR